MIWLFSHPVDATKEGGVSSKGAGIVTETGPGRTEGGGETQSTAGEKGVSGCVSRGVSRGCPSVSRGV